MISDTETFPLPPGYGWSPDVAGIRFYRDFSFPSPKKQILYLRFQLQDRVYEGDVLYYMGFLATTSVLPRRQQDRSWYIVVIVEKEGENVPFKILLPLRDVLAYGVKGYEVKGGEAV
jgi:hypothetical protein